MIKQLCKINCRFLPPKAKALALIFIIIGLSFFSIFFSLTKGSLPVSLYELITNKALHPVLFKLRLARTLTAFVSGGLLALAGVLMQLLLYNPLADPYALGVSSGAAVVALIMILLGAGSTMLMGGAWFGSLVTISFIFLLSRKHRWQPHSLLLIGIALACGFSACITFILLISPAANLHSMLFWLTGDLNTADFPTFALGVLLIGLIICMLLARGLNILARGEKEARALGVASSTYRLGLYLLSSLFTATAVTLSGCIGFIGLIVPHLTRQLLGFDHRLLLPAAALLGGSLLTFADTLARTIIAPEQLPAGLLLALLGVPIFIWLLQK